MIKSLAHGLAVLALCLVVGLPASAQLNAITRSGLDLTPEDWELLETAASKLYLTNEATVGTVETWSNQESGNRGRVELIRTGERQGMPCRRLQHDIRVQGTADAFRFTVDRCKTPEGAWKVL